MGARDTPCCTTQCPCEPKVQGGGTYLSAAEVCAVLTEAYQPALERAAVAACEGRYADVELGHKVDRVTIEQKALELIL